MNLRRMLFSAAAVLSLAVAPAMPAMAATVSTSGDIPGTSAAHPPAGDIYRLRLYHLHTGEHIDVIYRIGNQYLPAAVAELDHFLRDHRTNDVKDYDVKEFDLLHDLLAKLHDPNGEIDIVCGYRTPWSNNYLRTHGGGVAEHSQHMQAKAIDIRVPGVATTQVRDAALTMARGGVGYYPVSNFVHVDVGPVRHWQYR